MSSNVVWGSGGHAKCTASILLEQNVKVAYLIDEYNTAVANETWNGILVINAKDFELNNEFSVIVAIGDNLERKRVQNKILNLGVQVKSVFSGSSITSNYAEFGVGCQIMRGAIICNDVVVGAGTIVNSGAIIEHGCSVGTYCHIAPGAVLLGNCSLGNDVMIGSNSTIFPNVEIVDGVTIGAGITVRRNILTKSAIVRGELI